MFDNFDYIFTVFLVHVSIYWGLAGIFLLLDNLLTFEQLLRYKTPIQRLYLTRAGKQQFNVCKVAFYRVTRNHFCMAIMTVPLHYILDRLNVKFQWECSPKILIETILYILLSDLSFYTSHRLCHSSQFLYNKIHREHHEWKASMAIAASDMGLIDYFLTTVLPVYTCVFVCSSVSSILFGLVIITISIVLSHSGYYIPFFNENKHDIHHMYHRYNFSGIWDTILGTYSATGSALFNPPIPLLCSESIYRNR